MLNSPITVTINAVGQSLSRINQDNYQSVYLKKTADYELRLTIRHSYEGKVGPGQMERHNVDMTRTTWDTDGKPIVTQTYSVIRVPRGTDTAQLLLDLAGFNAFVTANGAALVAWES